jgi:hypothetical protein
MEVRLYGVLRTRGRSVGANRGLVPEWRQGVASRRRRAMTTSDVETGGRHMDIGDTRLYVVERGHGYPLLVFHGGRASTIICSATTSTL